MLYFQTQSPGDAIAVQCFTSFIDYFVIVKIHSPRFIGLETKQTTQRFYEK